MLITNVDDIQAGRRLLLRLLIRSCYHARTANTNACLYCFNAFTQRQTHDNIKRTFAAVSYKELKKSVSGIYRVDSYHLKRSLHERRMRASKKM